MMPMDKKREDWLKMINEIMNDIASDEEENGYMKRYEEFKKRKKGDRSIKLLFAEACEDCVVNGICSKSFIDGTVCDKLINHLRGLIDENQDRVCNE